MDSFELNKVLGAVLGTCLVLLALNITANAVFTVHPPHEPAYKVAVTEQPGPDAKPGPAAPEVPIATRLASADVSRGETSGKKCVACHTFGKGEPNRVGPNLWGIVGRERASHEGFNYSPAMKSHPGKWTFEELDAYLKNPQGMVPGTRMTFAGVPRATERADLISFLNTKSDSPQSLPKAADATPAPPAPQAATPPAAPTAPAATSPAAAPPAPKPQ